jgi:hypothetical protein
MQTDKYEYHIDSSIEEDSDHPINVESIYKNITDLLRKIVDNNPLSNKLPLSGAIKSRITVLTDLCGILCDRYEYEINYSWFQFMLDDLTEAIYGIAKLVDGMESKYEYLKGSLDTGARSHVRIFPSPLDKYLNATRRNNIKDFNRFISDEYWLEFCTLDKEWKPLPLLDELKIPEDLI